MIWSNWKLAFGTSPSNPAVEPCRPGPPRAVVPASQRHGPTLDPPTVSERDCLWTWIGLMSTANLVVHQPHGEFTEVIFPLRHVPLKRCSTGDHFN